ncbi:MAG: hypothetical protein EOO90_06370 [Pedobacter sp.]|nr:MAG: hypothetical protein EOO90_06370 [Pedobacter sp.]
MDQHILSRIDRAVADNLKDIERSFGEQAGLVQDFIMFISRQLKTDLFGYTRFTVQQFCEHTGRNRQDLALVHPDFSSGRKQPPEIQGYAFQTVLDYALYAMMERNIIFSRSYEVKGHNSVVHMTHFPILKDLKLNFNRKDKQQKIYDIRLSDELISGFLSRYYIIDSESYKLVGKGRGGDSRKKLLIYLSKISHVLHSTSTATETTIPLDRICRFADINDIKPSHKKQNLQRMLTHLKCIGRFPIHFEFVSYRGSSEYALRLAFLSGPDRMKVQKEHTFYYRLLNGMRDVFNLCGTGPATPSIEEDPFQNWLINRGLNTAEKARVLQQAYYIAFSINLPDSVATDLVLSGDFLKPLI